MTEFEKLTKDVTKGKFLKKKENFAIAEHYLRRALEAVFDIGGHIISSFPYSPSKRPAALKEVAVELGNRGILNKDFAKNTLTKMAGYRNRMVHFYNELTAGEIYEIVTKDLGDFDIFTKGVLNLLENPQKYDLTVEDV